MPVHAIIPLSYRCCSMENLCVITRWLYTQGSSNSVVLSTPLQLCWFMAVAHSPCTRRCAYTRVWCSRSTVIVVPILPIPLFSVKRASRSLVVRYWTLNSEYYNVTASLLCHLLTHFLSLSFSSITHCLLCTSPFLSLFPCPSRSLSAPEARRDYIGIM